MAEAQLSRARALGHLTTLLGLGADVVGVLRSERLRVAEGQRAWLVRLADGRLVSLGVPSVVRSPALLRKVLAGAGCDPGAGSGRGNTWVRAVEALLIEALEAAPVSGVSPKGDIEGVGMTVMEEQLRRAAELLGPVDSGFEAPGPVGACSAVVAGAKFPLLCVRHPDMGLVCSECMTVHLDRDHHDMRSRACDLCGEHHGWVQPRAVEVQVEGLPLSHPELGGVALLAGPVVLFGAAVCGACTAAGLAEDARGGVTVTPPR